MLIMSDSNKEITEESFSDDREYRLARLRQTVEELRKAEEVSEAKLKKAQERLQQTQDNLEKSIWAATFKWSE